MSLDIFLFSFLHSFAEKLSFFNFLFALCAVGIPYFLFLAFLFFVFKNTTYGMRFSRLIFASAVMLVSRGVLTETLHFFFPRPRPYEMLHFTPLFEAVGPAFPSGHAALLFALAFSVFLMDRKWGTWFFVFATINGFARVLSGVHWASDVLGGIIIAAASYFLVLRIVGIDFKKKVSESRIS